MKSRLPKVLHPVCGRPMLHWTIDAAQAAGAGKVVAIVRPGEGVEEAVPDGVEVARQTEGEGTGSAVLSARDQVASGQTVVILSGDHPLIAPDTIEQLVAGHERDASAATLLTTDQLDPTGYGRVVRDSAGHVERIVETKHAEGVDPGHLAIREINLGTYAFNSDDLFHALDKVGQEHGERYLTAVFELFRNDGKTVAAHLTDDVLSGQGVNDRADLMDLEKNARDRLIRDHAKNGVSFPLPATVLIDAGVQIGPDTTIEPGTVLRGATKIGTGCTIGPNTTVTDATLGDEVRALHAHIDDSTIGNGVSIGPFAYIRPGTQIHDGAKIGTYVEVKNSVIGARTKVPHLSYLGDADIGEDCNIAAGNITANYHRGVKSRTRIGNGVKTGVDTMFVAPVAVGDGAYTAAGSVITEDVPPGALGIARPDQKNIEGYAERLEKELGDGKR
jgi:bifunctional UDP-N-acetylglucosamine pyrophosphorylase/glucosamine-1-phosphate N-acetyltransferase